MTTRAKTPKVCKLLQPLTQNGIISAAKASEIVREYVRGNMAPMEQLINGKDFPVAFMPVVEELRKEVMQ